MSKSLEDLGREYLDNIKSQEQLLERLKEKRKIAMRNRNTDEVEKLNIAISEAYIIVKDLKIIGEHLISYYDDSRAKERFAV